MLDIKDQMALDVGVSYWDLGSFRQHLEGLGAVLHLLPYCIHPECGPRFGVQGLGFLDILRDLNSVLLVNPKVLLLRGLDDPIPFLHGVGNPPSKGWFLCKTIVYGILGHLKQV